jgi:preprotein translocase subunit YajC
MPGRGVRDAPTRLAAVLRTDSKLTEARPGRLGADRKASTVLYAASGQSGSSYTLYLLMALLFVGMYFFMIRPQQKRRRDIEAMQSTIGPGDEVITIGGLYGTVTEIDDEAVTLEVAPGVTNRYARGAIGRVVSSAAAATDSTANPVAEAD